MAERFAAGWASLDKFCALEVLELDSAGFGSTGMFRSRLNKETLFVFAGMAAVDTELVDRADIKSEELGSKFIN